MCLKTFLHDRDKSCHHQHYFLSPPDQALAHSGLHVSASRHSILIGHFCRDGVGSPDWERLNATCETRDSFLPGWGIKNGQTQTTSAPVVAQAWRAYQKPTPFSVLRNSVHFIKHSPFQPVSKLSEQGAVCGPT